MGESKIMKFNRHKTKLTATWLGLALCGSQTALQAATIPVTNLSDSDPGSLRDAIATAASGDMVDATGITGTIVLASELNVDKSLTINGPGQDVLIISGNHVTRVFNLSLAGSTVTLSGLTVADGHQAFAPGPDDNQTASGGIFSRANLTLSHCTVRGNTIPSDAGWWAAGGIASFGPLKVTYCTITQNYGYSGYGGGIAANPFGIVTTTIADSTISQNGPDGVYAAGLGELYISRSSVSENTFVGIAAKEKYTLDQCTVSGNGMSGAEVSQPGLILNSTIVGNPIGISADPGPGAGLIGNTIFANGRDIRQEQYPTTNDRHPTSLGHNITSGNANGDGSTGPGGWLNQPTDRRNTDPLLGPLQNNGGPTATHALLAGSPAINAGGSDEVQVVFIVGRSGTFTLTFNGQTTEVLPYDASADQVQNALNALSSISGVGGSVGVVPVELRNGFVVGFTGGSFIGQNLPPMTGSGSGGVSLLLRTLSDGGAVPDFDQRGFPRVVNGRMDIGAFEFNTAPQVSCSTPSNFDCIPATGLIVAVQAVVSDPDADQSLTVILKQGTVVLDTQTVTSPAAGALVTFNSVNFLPGLHPLTVEVSDGIEVSHCETTLTVNADTEAPKITCPASLEVPAAPGNTGARVNYPAPVVSDNCSVANVSCTPPSGSVFPLGITTVRCTVTDGVGLQTTGTFTVTVLSAADQIRRCITLVDGFDLKNEKELMEPLKEALEELAKAKKDSFKKASQELGEFIQKVQNGLRKRQLTSDQAARLIACATQAQITLGNP